MKNTFAYLRSKKKKSEVQISDIAVRIGSDMSSAPFHDDYRDMHHVNFGTTSLFLN